MILLPPSKSIGARYLVATYFAGTLPADPIFEDNDDLMVLQQALLQVYSDEEPIDYGDSQIDVGASGTALRFVTAVCASSPGADYIITGTNRLMQRPMEPLIHLLRDAGSPIECLGESNSGPYRVAGSKLQGGSFSIRGDISSQFISALMLVAPLWDKGMKLQFTTPLVSAPYVEMTARLMKEFGIKTNLSETGVEVNKANYIDPENFKVEADWSSASFFYEACALGANDIFLQNLVAPESSLQGDATTASIFNQLGVVSVFNKEGAQLTLNEKNRKDKIILDFKNCPDLVLPVAVACICSNVKFRFENVAHLRHKESDRIESLTNEARKIGFDIKADENSIEWSGERVAYDPDPVIDPHDDHRVAMAFAPAALKLGKIRISHPEVVEKSFIDFWNQLASINLDCVTKDNIMTVSLPQSV